jgi:hypothetical protein
MSVRASAATVSAGRRVGPALAVLAWGVLPLVASRFSLPLRLLPALGILRGPLGVAVAVLTIGLAALRLIHGSSRTSTGDAPGRPRTLEPSPALTRIADRVSSAHLFGVAAILFFSTGLWYASRLRVSGDEPHYLLMAQSFWREGDLDLRDNLAREDFREYTPGPLAPHYGAPRRDGRPFPAHSPGLPVLLAPVYAVAGRLGVVALIALFAASMAALSHRMALDVTGDRAAALAAWTAAIGPPLFFYSFHVYTEAPTGALLAGSLVLASGTGGMTSALAAGLLVGALPWLHLKMAGAAVAVLLIGCVRLRGPRRAAFGFVALLSMVALLAFYRSIFGHTSPFAVYGGVPADATGSPARAAVGLMLDRSFGLLPFAPVFLLAAPGTVALFRGNRRQAFAFLACAMAVIAPILVWRMWWGGQCPPGRFLVPLVPLLALTAACCVVRGGGLARWFWPLAGVGLALALFMSLQPGELLLLNRGDRPTRVWAALDGEGKVARYLPSIVSADPAEARVASVWMAAFLLLLVLDAQARRHVAIDRLFRSGAAALLLLLLVSVAIDRWARPIMAAAPPLATVSVATGEPEDSTAGVRAH